MDGLALAIAAASLCMLLVPGLLGATLGYFALRKRARWVGVVIGFVIGIGLGGLAVAATFFESTFSPPDELSIDAPGLRHETVIFVEDAHAPSAVEWTGSRLPFSSRIGHVAVPASGVLRVRSVDWIGGREVRARLVTGMAEQSLSVRDVPPLGRVVVFGFAPYPGTEADPAVLDPPSLLALIREREAER